ncbi:DUF2946 family protein [Roseicella aquatilis]|nr:DUF2946 family protein [Roseicella aquatilis]
MAHRAAPFRLLLALLLSVQWAGALAHCLFPWGLAPLAAAGGGHAVEICSAEGLHMVLLGEDGQPQAPAGPRHGTCPLCPGGAAPSPEAPAALAEPVRYAAAAFAPPPAGLPPAPPRAPPQQPRAPPLA